MRPTPFSVNTSDFASPGSAPERPGHRRAPARFLRLLAGTLLLALATLAPAPRAAAADGSEAVVVYAASNADSKAVAEHYARARKVPEKNLIPLWVESDSAITRDQYIRQIETPLLAELEKRGLATFIRTNPPPAFARNGTLGWRCTASSVRYLVLCYGMPFKIVNDPKASTEFPTNYPAQLRRNDASVDSEVALLPSTGMFPLVGAFPNLLYGTTNRAALHPTNGLFLVGRLDGPTPAIAKGLVDKALVCEQIGFTGNAYFDLRNIHSGGYKTGDEWITNAAAACRRVGLSTYVDNRPETIPSTFPMSHVGVYAGWYTEHVDGPFALPEVEFMPGAIAYHLHSYNGATPRDPRTRWVGPLLAKGATVTFGSVDEPYLDFTPNPHVFLQLLVAADFTVGEAALASQQFLSWVNVFYGDPLFTPFTRNLTALENRLAAEKNPSIVWTVLRKANYLLENGANASAIRESLASYPLTTNSAVLSEKVAALFAEASQLRGAIEWGRRALTLNPSPQQRLRLLLNLAEWQDSSIKREEAFESLLEVEKLRPDYRELIPFRERQLQLARDIARPAEVERLKAEIKRIQDEAERAREAQKKP